MALHNRVQSHMEMRPCRQCGVEVKALNARGNIDLRPICSTCSQEFGRQFKEATAQRKRQEMR